MKARISREERVRGGILYQEKRTNNKRKGGAFQISSINIIEVEAP
jgi:hypothetical protein